MLKKKRIRYLFRAIPVFFATLLLLPSMALAQKSAIRSPQPLPSDITPKVFLRQCGDFMGHYGPMDYRTAHPDDKRVVETYHLYMEYSTFLQGKLRGKNRSGTGDVGGGFQYTLKSFPNHPTALYAMERLGFKLSSERPQNTDYPLECWFVRAFQIAPDDPIVRALYGIYLANRGRSEEALHNLAIADKELRDSANMQYNIGLSHFKLGKFELAQLNTLRASRLGFRLNGLEHMLKNSGHWNSQLEIPSSESEELLEIPTVPSSGEASRR